MADIKSGAWNIAAKTAATVLKGDANAVYSPACIYEGFASYAWAPAALPPHNERPLQHGR